MKRILSSLIYAVLAVYFSTNFCVSQVTPPCAGWKCLTFSGLNDGALDLNGEWQSDPDTCQNTAYHYTSTDHPGIHLCHHASGQNWIFTDTFCDNTLGNMLARCWRARHNIQYCGSADWNIQDGAGGEYTSPNAVSVTTIDGNCPTSSPTNNPILPTNAPVSLPPTQTPSDEPTSATDPPTASPTKDPTTASPTKDPTTASHTKDPSHDPTRDPTLGPTPDPTMAEGQIGDETTRIADDKSEDEAGDNDKNTGSTDSDPIISVGTAIIVLGSVFCCLFAICTCLVTAYVVRVVVKRKREVVNEPGQKTSEDTIPQQDGVAGEENTGPISQPEAVQQHNVPQAESVQQYNVPQQVGFSEFAAPAAQPPPAVYDAYNNNMIMANREQEQQAIGEGAASLSGDTMWNNQITMGAPLSYSGVNNPVFVEPQNEPVANVVEPEADLINNDNCQKCADCEQVKEGKIFPDNGMFYCLECWDSYE